MTIAELIAELQKYPGHYTAMISTEFEDPNSGGLESELHFVGDVQLMTNIGAWGCVVTIISE